MFSIITTIFLIDCSNLYKKEMIRALLQVTAVLVVLPPTTVLADYGDLWITGADISQGKPIQGRLEFEDRNGVWGTVCDVGFTERAGNVACKQLGFVRVEKVLYKQFGNQSRLAITICATECTGKESRLSQCQLKSCKDNALYQLPCKKENVVGIQCTNRPSPTAEVKGDNRDEVGSGVGNVNENGNPIDDEDNDDNNNDHDDGSGGTVGNVDNSHVGNDHNNNDQDDNTAVVSSPGGTHANTNNQDDEKVDVSLPKLNDGTDVDNDSFLPSGELDESQSDRNSERQSDREHSDDSISSGAILGIVLSCLFVAAVILFVLGIVFWGYRQHHANFVVTQDYPRILVASDTATTTTTIPKSYIQSSRLTPKGYKALPITDYVAVQPVIKKPVY